MPLLSSIANDTASSGYTVLKYGATGDSVKQLQQTLSNAGYYTGVIDGSYGPKTLSAVKAYQTSAGLSVDGVAGPATQGSLYTTKPTTPQIVKPQAQKTQGYTDTGTGGQVSQTTTKTPTVPTPGVPLPEDVARMQGSNAVQTPTPTAPGTPRPEDIARMNGPNAVNPPPAPGIIPGSTIPGRTDELGGGGQPVRGGIPPGGVPLPEDIARMNGSNADQAQVDAQNRDKTEGVGPDTDPKLRTDESMGFTSDTGTGTGGSGGIGTGGSGGTGGTGGTGSDGTDTGTGSSVVDNGNPYIDKIDELVFEYNPGQDQNYLRMASALESQIMQSMASRGGLYSSVAGYALQIGLVNLQMEMYDKAWESFKEERDFLLEMSRDYEDRLNAAFSRDMATKEYELSLRKEEFDQRMAIAAHNLSVSRLSYQKTQDALAYAQKQKQIELEEAQLLADQKYDQDMDRFNYNKTVIDVTEDKAIELNDRWLEDTYATDPEVQAFFGVVSRTTWAAGSGMRSRVYDSIETQKDQLAKDALDLKLYSDYKDIQLGEPQNDISETITTSVDGTTISRTQKIPQRN